MDTLSHLTETIARANRLASDGEIGDAIELLQSAAATAAGATELDADSRRVHGDICKRLGQLLEGADRLPEAMQAYQEAVDCYTGIRSAESDADVCAKRIVAGVKAMWKRPDRLYLLIARMDRERRQMAKLSGSESGQAENLFKTATILQRRDRFEDAAARYEEALSLYEQSTNTGMEQAACHHRLAGLHQYELNNPSLAIVHYQSAISLYRQHEPDSDGEQMNRRLCEDLLRRLLVDRMLKG